MLSNIEQTIRDYLPEVIHLSLASSRDNKPWVCEVHYVYDDDLNLYFRSTAACRHSTEIHENPYVAGNIVKQHGLGEKPRGVYFEGTAKMLNNVDEQHVAFQRYCERFDTNSTILEDAHTESDHKFYKITVRTWYVFDALESNPSKKYELSWR